MILLIPVRWQMLLGSARGGSTALSYWNCVITPWMVADEDMVSHVLSHVVWWKKIYIYRITQHVLGLTNKAIFKQNYALFMNTVSFLHTFQQSQISFPGPFFWGLYLASRRLGPDLENRVVVEAIRTAIHVVLPSLRSTCNTVHCLGERALFSSSFVAVFLAISSFKRAFNTL